MVKGRDQKLEWKAWFGSAEAKEAKEILQEASRFQTPDLESNTVSELRVITSVRPTVATTDVYASLQALTLKDLEGYVEAETRRLEVAASEWERKRNTGWRKVRTNFQRFSMVFGRFIEGFSGVLEIVKIADNQYGGAATKILSILYATVKVKVTTDEAVIAAMETITDRLPDVAIYGQVYADTKLAVMMAKAYKEVVGFAVQATTYFQKHGFTRALKAIGNPTKFPDLNVELVKNFTTIRARCEALLAQRVAELSQQNIELLRQMKLLNERQDVERARQLHQALGLGLGSGTGSGSDEGGGRGGGFLNAGATMTDRLARHRHLLRCTFGDRAQPDLEQFALPDLRAEPEFAAWADPATGSGLLLLHGTNHDSQMAVGQSWLELAAVDLVGELQSGRRPGVAAAELKEEVEVVADDDGEAADGKTALVKTTAEIAAPDAQNDDGGGRNAKAAQQLVAHVLCSPSDTAASVLKSCIAQLLELRPSVLREAADARAIEDLVTTAPSPSDGGDNDEGGFDDKEKRRQRRQQQQQPSGPAEQARLADLALALRRIVALCDGGGAPVFLVLLRPELCGGGVTMWQFLVSLLELVVDGGKRAESKGAVAEDAVLVKVLAVVRTERWNIGPRLADMDEEVVQSGKFAVIRRDQAEIVWY